MSLDLNNVRDRNIEDLSGGELQRFACAIVCVPANYRALRTASFLCRPLPVGLGFFHVYDPYRSLPLGLV